MSSVDGELKNSLNIFFSFHPIHKGRSKVPLQSANHLAILSHVLMLRVNEAQAHLLIVECRYYRYLQLASANRVIVSMH